MKRQEIIDRFASISTWKRGDERAPHKPLLLLTELGRCSRGEPREVRYLDVEKKLGSLLVEYGPSRKSYHPEYPFWRLQTDGIWTVSDHDRLEARTGKDDARKSSLRKVNPTGALDAEIWDALRGDPALLREVTAMLLDEHFPATIHEDILAEVGLELEYVVSKRAKRDPTFRARVLRAYEHRCAVCGFDLKLGHADLALEAAHIKWHQAGGPDIESNGLALCTMHHKMFDRGAFTVTEERVVVVSQDVYGSSGLGEYLGRFHGDRLRMPQAAEYEADLRFLGWHQREVFRCEQRRQ